MNTTDQPFQQALQKLYRRAARDAAFRQLCLRDSRAAFREAGGTEAPADFKVHFVEDRAATLFVLPPLRESDELEDAELADVAGAAGGNSATCDWHMGIATCNASGPQITYG